MEAQLAKKLDAFFGQFLPQDFPKNSILIRAAEVPKGIFYLTQGHVRQYVITESGEEMTLNMYKPGAFFPMSWAVNESVNRYYFEAMDDAKVCLAPKDAVVAFVKKEPDILFDLLQRLFRGVEGMLSRAEHLMSGDALSRLITVLVILAKRFGENRQTNIVIDIRLTHQDLASLAGLSRETVSREMIKLKEQKLINYTSTGITIGDLDHLEERLHGVK